MNINIKQYGNGYPLVFFHGWGFDSQVWLPLVPQLMMNYQVIVVDLPGFGHSSIMDWDIFKHNLLNVLPKHFALIGWSLGGLFAIRLAVEHSDRVEYLVNITSSPRFLLDGLWPGISSEVFKRFYQKLSADPHIALRDFLELQGLKADDNLQQLPNKLPTLAGLETGLNILETWDLREELKRFVNPACFMFGRLDPIVPIKTMNQMQVLYPQFNYVLFNRAAHLPFLSHADLFIKEMRGFIK
ncbi:MAG: alpha/beta fold hydrolase [Legionella longbeachae]|nr:alpha/beta fold hydrolase [Legionella longbeachae]